MLVTRCHVEIIPKTGIFTQGDIARQSMAEWEKYADYSSRDKTRSDLIGAAIVFVFIGSITVVTLMLVSWWLQ